MLILIAVDIKAVAVLGRSPILAYVRLAVDLDHGSDLEHGRAGDNI